MSKSNIERSAYQPPLNAQSQYSTSAYSKICQQTSVNGSNSNQIANNMPTANQKVMYQQQYAKKQYTSQPQSKYYAQQNNQSLNQQPVNSYAAMYAANRRSTENGNFYSDTYHDGFTPEQYQYQKQFSEPIGNINSSSNYNYHAARTPVYMTGNIRTPRSLTGLHKSYSSVGVTNLYELPSTPSTPATPYHVNGITKQQTAPMTLSKNEPSLDTESIAKRKSNVNNANRVNSNNNRKATKQLLNANQTEANNEEEDDLNDTSVCRQYQRLLQESKTKLNDLCKQYQSHMEGPSRVQNEEALGQIQSVVGKAHLLVNQKLKQFGELCASNIKDKQRGSDQEGNESGKFTTRDEDLAGFWDMVSIQIEDVTRMFAKLEELKARGWRMPRREIETPRNNRVPLARSSTTTSVERTETNATRLRQEAARKKIVEYNISHSTTNSGTHSNQSSARYGGSIAGSGRGDRSNARGSGYSAADVNYYGNN